ncbi:MAG: hypothetical protein AAF628_08490 [Planctomycetota bacterium]
MTASAIRDQIALFGRAGQLREPAFKAASAIQDERPHIQILALATALAAECDAIQMNPHDVVQMVERAKQHIDGPFSTQYRALIEYFQGEFVK